MQPLTFALTIVSALSLYSLFFTIYRSRLDWNAARRPRSSSGSSSWLLAGLSGVVNATIAFDQVVHNTLWIVGHFHHMALLNIGFVIFGAIYYFLPELIGQAALQRPMARWHIWLTFVFGTDRASALWLVQGLEGAPRRFAVLPHRYDEPSQAAIPFVIALALDAAALRLQHRPDDAGAKKKPRAVATAEALFILAAVAARDRDRRDRLLPRARHRAEEEQRRDAHGHRPGRRRPHDDRPARRAPPPRARQLFVHELRQLPHAQGRRDATGAVGPNLDDLKPSLARVAAQVTNGGTIMPSFKGSLTPAQIAAVAAYVSSVAGK